MYTIQLLQDACLDSAYVVMQTAVSRRATRQLSAAWASWMEAVHLSQAKAQRALSYFHTSSLRHAFEAWRSQMQRNAEKQKVGKAVTCFTHGSMQKAFAGWGREHNRAVAKREVMQKATNLLQRSRLVKVIPSLNRPHTVQEVGNLCESVAPKQSMYMTLVAAADTLVSQK